MSNKHICPSCGYCFQVDPQQASAARSRWAALTPEQRSAEMSRIRRKGLTLKTTDEPALIARLEVDPHAILTTRAKPPKKRGK